MHTHSHTPAHRRSCIALLPRISVASIETIETSSRRQRANAILYGGVHNRSIIAGRAGGRKPSPPVTIRAPTANFWRGTYRRGKLTGRRLLAGPFQPPPLGHNGFQPPSNRTVGLWHTKKRGSHDKEEAHEGRAGQAGAVG